MSLYKIVTVTISDSKRHFSSKFSDNSTYYNPVPGKLGMQSNNSYKLIIDNRTISEMVGCFNYSANSPVILGESSDMELYLYSSPSSILSLWGSDNYIYRGKKENIKN